MQPRVGGQVIPALAIKEQAGHASLTTTQRYMHLSPKAKRRAVELLDEMVGDNKETAHGSWKNAWAVRYLECRGDRI